MEIKNVMIVKPTGIINNADIVIKGKKISSITEKEGNAELMLVPGFIDTHIHGLKGNDAMDSKKAVEEISKDIVAFGVTTFLPTLMTAPDKVLMTALRNASKAQSKGAKIAGLHVEGPFLSLEKKGAHDAQYLQRGTIHKFDEYFEASNKTIKKITMAPEECEDGFLMNLLNKKVIASIGHSNASIEQANKFFEDGGQSGTHLWNAMSGKLNDKEGVVGSMLAGNGIAAELISDLIHNDEDRVKSTIETIGPDGITIVSDSIRPAGLEDGQYESGGLPILKRGMKITLAEAGNIAGSGSNLHDMFKILVNLGFDLMDVVKMTSTNSAVQLGLTKNGTIEEGYLADMVLMDRDLEIKEVFIEGVAQ